MNGWIFALLFVGLVIVGILIGFSLLQGPWCGVFSEYPGQITFHGCGHSNKMTYYGVTWTRNELKPTSCPFVIHLAEGDRTAADFADPKILQDRGWVCVMNDKDFAGAPLILNRSENNYSINLTYVDGILVCVTVNIKSLNLLETETHGIALTIDGKKIRFPLEESELHGILGPPVRRETGVGD